MKIKHPPHRLRAFTLIELLVVISIIGVLMSLLLPALSEARIVAFETTDGTTLKGIGVAVNAYAADFKDWTPHRQSFAEADGIGTISTTNSGRIAGASAMSERDRSSSLTLSEDGVTLNESINVPTGIGQLVSSVQVGATQATTTYTMGESYLKARETFAKSDQLNDEPNRPDPRNHWWRFVDVAYKAPYSSPWASNALYNGFQWSTGAASAGTSVNYCFRPSFHIRGADYATANADDTLTGNNNVRNFRLSEPIRNGKVMAMSRDPNTINYYGKALPVGCHLMLNDGSVQFSTNSYWRSSAFNSGASWVVLPSGAAAQNNPYTNEGSVQSYKITNAYAYADKYMRK